MSSTKTRQKYKRLYWIIKAVRKDFPVSLPIKVKRKKLKDLFGYASKGKKCYYIYIDEDLDRSVAIDTFIHEMGHILTWEISDTIVDHGQEWGKAYSRLYRWMEKSYFPKVDAGEI